jgi:gluconate 2-dehydrogenase gamma chain
MNTRRDLLKIMAAVPAAAAAQHVHPTGTLTQIAQARAPQAFDAAQFKTLTRLVDLILPRSDTPGAADSGVQFQIDDEAKAKPALHEQVARGLAALDTQARAGHGKAFLELAETEQIALLQSASNDPQSAVGRFFQLSKDMTIDGYYRTREGLEKELGWHGNTYVAEFKGCTHPEHQS